MQCLQTLKYRGHSRNERVTHSLHCRLLPCKCSFVSNNIYIYLSKTLQFGGKNNNKTWIDRPFESWVKLCVCVQTVKGQFFKVDSGGRDDLKELQMYKIYFNVWNWQVLALNPELSKNVTANSPLDSRSTLTSIKLKLNPC